MAETKTVENPEQMIEQLEKTIADSTRTSIWFEILRKPGITAKELMKIIDIKKTAMYYHLNLLEENEIITCEISKKVKYYKIKINFFEIYTRKNDILKLKKKELDLFSLYIIQSLIQREISKVLHMSDAEYHRPKYPVNYTGMWFCSKERLQQIKGEFDELTAKIRFIDKDDADTIIDSQLAMYWGLVGFE
ncbi:MAG: winged helix-turn-helix transcriptional regulator [Asgard group archaeon]|nr:winged helix-turn-helix transcriptional regulator [Asgard group archaeon]